MTTKDKTRPNTNSTGKRLFFARHLGCRALSYQPSSSLRDQTRCAVEINLLALGTAGGLGGAGLEAVLEAALDVAEVAHSAGAGGLSALGLLAPVVCVQQKIVSFNPNSSGADMISIIDQAREHNTVWMSGEFVHLRVLAEG